MESIQYHSNKKKYFCVVMLEMFFLFEINIVKN